MATVTMSTQNAQPQSAANVDETAINDLESALFDLVWLGQKQFAVELAPFNLTIPQFFTLLFVASREEGATMSELAVQTRHSLATMTGIVDRLVKLKLVERADHPRDRRIVLVKLTDEGHQRVTEVRAARRQQLAQAFESLPNQDRPELVRLLRAFAAALGVHDSPSSVRGGRRRAAAE